jgi:signal transduction histidine kinase
MKSLARRLSASVRVRVTATAMVAVMAALIITVGIIDITLTHDRQRILVDTATQDAREVMAFNPTLTPPLYLPRGSTIDTGFIQVVSGGRVIGASRGLRRDPELWSQGQPLIGPAPDGIDDLAPDVQVVAVPVQTGTAGQAAYVGRAGPAAYVVVVLSMQQFDHTVGDVLRLLEIGLPVLLLLVGLICWLIVGRALRPIELMRLEVDGVAAGDRRGGAGKGGRSGGASYRVAEPAYDDEVGRLARTLNSMLDRIEASAVRERRFVSDASHELRTPIANIRTGLEVALAHPEATDWLMVAGEALDQNERMEELVAGLLLLARSDEGSLVEAAEPTDLAAVAARVVDDLERETRRGHHPPVELRAEPARMRVPSMYAERMVANLVDNARRFAVSRLSVDVCTAGTDVVLTVTDDGPGVPPEDRERIFERFVRLDEARDRGEGGFGLGLAIVADLARFYGGTIRVEEAEGGGARFVLRLPAAATLAGAGALTPSGSPPPRPDPVPSY